ncbi:MAG: Fe2+-enterobactin ABC transporter substrate-binding protein [Paraglaciecola sp.]|uniref:Fe2+-enterobactin ABC transporter substrate-binding protein n=1 Tax=Paraglaciecola sp. TaxID=1920173 RepID=UPI003297D2DC
MSRFFLLSSFFVLVYFSSPAPALADAWPRHIKNADGTEVVIDKAPLKVLSTSVTVTGTLLAIDAPVVASASATTNQFFSQWQKVADARGVINLWPAGRIDFEAVYEIEPDLIIVSLTGADSVMAHVEMLRSIAPVLVVDYASSDWQGLAKTLARAMGLEAQADAKISEFDQHVYAVKQSISPPSGSVNIVSYNGPGIINPIGLASGAHGTLLTSLGFKVAPLHDSLLSEIPVAGDFIRTNYEQLTTLTAQSTFLLRRSVDDTAGFLNASILKNLPSVQNAQVWGLGENSFRMDLYSANETIDIIHSAFAK